MAVLDLENGSRWLLEWLRRHCKIDEGIIERQINIKKWTLEWF
jgi:hypothetical protein